MKRYVILFVSLVVTLAACDGSHSFHEAKQAYEQGDFTKAESLFLEALSKEGENPSYYLAYGNFLLTIGEYKEAAALFQIITEEQIKAEEEWKKKASLGLGAALLRLNQTQEAMSYLEAGLSFETIEELDDAQLAWLGEAQLAQEDFQKAEETYSSLILRQPENGSLYEVRGSIRLKLEKYAECVTDFQNALVFSQENFFVYSAYYKALVALGQETQAGQLMNKAVAAGHGEAYFYLGEVAVKEKKYEEAAAFYQEFLAVSKEEILSSRALQQQERIEIYLLEQKGDFENAYQKLLTYQQNWPEDKDVELELKFLKERI